MRAALVFLALLALVVATPAQATHGPKAFSGKWTTNIGGVNFVVVGEAEGASGLQSLAGQPCGAPTTYYRGYYYDANNTGVIVACERSLGHLVGRYISEGSQRPQGDGEVDVTFAAPNQFSGYYTGDDFPGQTFPYSGTFQGHFDGDGCCPASDPSPPAAPGGPTGEAQLAPCPSGGLASVAQEVLDDCYTIQSGPGRGRVGGIKGPKVGPRVKEVGADIKFVDDNGTVVEGPDLVAIMEDRVAERAGIICFTVAYHRNLLRPEFQGMAFIKCADVVSRILARYDRILRKRQAGAGAARRGCGRVLRSRKRSRVKSKLRVTCSLTRAGAKVKIRPRSSRGTLRGALGSRSPKLFVGRSRLGPSGDLRIVTVWTAK